MGMVGGGRGAFIGAVHRMAAALDGEIELVCGALSSSPEKSRASAKDLHLPEEGSYGSFEEMIKTEAKKAGNDRMDLVSIVTPNHLHYAPAKMALEHGFHVICDKPVSFSVEEAESLKSIVDETGLIFGLTHNYTGYPMVKQARWMIREGNIGKIRRVVVEYPQGWLSTALEQTDHKQAEWRTDPNRSGAAGAMGDIGSHAENLAEYITGLEIESLCADLHAHIPGRLLDDDGSVLLRFKNGARGILYASQISAGEENDLRIRVYGEKGGLDWRQLEPNSLRIKWLDAPMQIYRAGGADICKSAMAHTRFPPGHPDGYLEAFANIYRNVAKCIQARKEGIDVDPIYKDFPGINDGIRGMRFIDAVVKSAASDQKWLVL